MSEPLYLNFSQMFSISIIVVTWNRRFYINRLINAIHAQNFPVDQLDLVIVDNHSTDDTVDFLKNNWFPDVVVQNPTLLAHQPQFQIDQHIVQSTRTKFHSITLICNHYNHGGCGGFNTGLAYVQKYYLPDYVWLIDDDADLPSNALKELISSAEVDPNIGLIGSRAVDINDKSNTLETTIYYDFQKGIMTPHPSPKHPLYHYHTKWIQQVKDTKGADRIFQGIREVDIVSACSLLARWSAVEEVGFWDYRYFIYCDDADWSLRFKKSGYKVICNLDAIVYHTPWFSKLTPARLYYAERNSIWLMQKIISPLRLKYLTFQKITSSIIRSIKNLLFCKKSYSDSGIKVVQDILEHNWGKVNLKDTDEFMPSTIKISKVIVVCNENQTHRDLITEAIKKFPKNAKFIYLVNSGSVIERELFGEDSKIFYSYSLWSRLYTSFRLFFGLGFVILIYNQTNPFPLFLSNYFIHIDTLKIDKALLEDSSFFTKIIFLFNCLYLWIRGCLYSLRISPYKSSSKYG